MTSRSRPPRATRYVLWFAPSGAVRTRLRRLISRLAVQYGTPAFAPHVTLLGHLSGARSDILATSESLARTIRPFTIHLGGAGFRDEFFECLFIHARHSRALMRANRLARMAFRRSGGRPFRPHLSLLYADLPVETKEAILDRTGRRFDIAFQVRHIELWAIRGGPDHWKRVKRIALHGANR